MKNSLVLALLTALPIVASLPSPKAIDETEKLLTKFPVAASDRIGDEGRDRGERLRVVAEELAVYPWRTRVALAVIADGESHFARYVLYDCTYRPKGSVGNCDDGKSRSYWQLQRNTCHPLFAHPAGQGDRDSVRIAIACAERKWRSGLSACKSIKGAVAYYAGLSCEGTRPSLQRKVDRMRSLGL